MRLVLRVALWALLAAVIPGCIFTGRFGNISFDNETEHQVVLNVEGFGTLVADAQVAPGNGVATGGAFCELDGTNTIRVRATVLAPGNETTVEAEIEYSCLATTAYAITEVLPGEFAIVLKVDSE